ISAPLAFSAGILSVDLAAGSGLTYDSGTGTFAIDFTSPNTWTGLQQFNGNASSTQFTSTGNTYLATAGGNVGVGTTTPAYKLDVWGSANAGDIFIGPWDANTDYNAINLTGRTGIGNYTFVSSQTQAQSSLFINRPTGGDIIFRENNTTQLTIKTDGNVGVGTPSPTAGLQVASSTGSATIFPTTLSIRSSTSASDWTGSNWGELQFYSDDASVSLANRVRASIGTAFTDTAGSLADLIFSTASGNALPTEKMRITSAGNVGIGTSTPGTYSPASPYSSAVARSLDITGASGSGDIAINLTRNDNSAIGGSLWYDASAGDLYFDNRWDSSGGNINFRTRTLGTTIDALTIEGTGNTGIGTSSPSYRLDVSTTGSNAARISSTHTGFNIIDMDAYGTGGAVQNMIRFLNAGTGVWSVGVNQANANSFIIGSGALLTSPKVVVTTAGNVGIGTSSPLSKLDIYGAQGSAASGLTISATTGSTGRLAIYPNGTDSTVFQKLSAGASLNFNSSVGGNELTLFSNGNVGIGTTSPSSNLSVQGNALFSGDISLANLTATGTATAANFVGTSASATSTLAGGLAIETSGLVYDFSSNKVGIGTASPTEKLTVTNTSAGARTTGIRLENLSNTLSTASSMDFVLSASSVTTGRISNELMNGGDRDLIFSAWNGSTLAESMRIRGNGNVGIGSTTPYAKLSVTNTGTGPSFIVEDSTSPDTTPFVIDEAGDVGIGTTTPVSKFVVSSANATAYDGADAFGQATTGVTTHIVNTQNSTDAWSQILFSNRAVTNSTTAIARIVSGYTGSVGSFIAFATQSGAQTVNERMRIDSTGNIGVGSTTPWAQLSINPSGITGPAFAIGSSTATNFIVTNGGRVGVGTTSPWRTLSVNGTVALSGLTSSATGNALCITTGGEVTNAGGATCIPSSIRYKENVATLPTGSALNILDQLHVVSFDYKSGAYSPEEGPGSYGLIAEEVATIDPKLVDYGYDGEPATIHFERLTGLNIQATQELNARTRFINSTASTTALSVTDAGNVGIGTTTSMYKLAVMGDVAATAFINISTKDAKTDIKYLSASSTEDILGQIRDMKVATYHYKIEDQHDPLRLGLIAEEAPDQVLSVDGKGVDIYKLTTFTLAGVQALAEKVDVLGMRMDSLEERLQKLEDGSITVSSGTPITFSTSTLASALEDLGVLIQKGIAQFDTLVARQFVAATDAAGQSIAGSGVVLSGNTVVEIQNPYAKATSKVLITMTSEVDGNWYLADKRDGSFRVKLSKAQTADVTFDFFIIQTEGQLAAPAAATTTPVTTNPPVPTPSDEAPPTTAATTPLPTPSTTTPPLATTTLPAATSSTSVADSTGTSTPATETSTSPSTVEETPPPAPGTTTPPADSSEPPQSEEPPANPEPVSETPPAQDPAPEAPADPVPPTP
ncbi:MAG: tail fiber domain-containing protein, partial [Minisyncoccia bacterium]